MSGVVPMGSYNRLLRNFELRRTDFVLFHSPLTSRGFQGGMVSRLDFVDERYAPQPSTSPLRSKNPHLTKCKTRSILSSVLLLLPYATCDRPKEVLWVVTTSRNTLQDLQQASRFKY